MNIRLCCYVHSDMLIHDSIDEFVLWILKS